MLWIKTLNICLYTFTCWNWGEANVDLKASWVLLSIGGRCSCSCCKASGLFIMLDKASPVKADDKSTVKNERIISVYKVSGKVMS